MEFAEIDWIAAGTRFAPDDLLSYQAKGKVPFAEAARKFELVLTGPHAAAAFPAEMRPYLAPSLTGRIQHDFSDIATHAVGLGWAGSDPRVLYIHNPHPRAVRDANRPKPKDPVADITAFLARMKRGTNDSKVGFAGIDAIRAGTFALLPVLRPDADIPALVACFAETASRGLDVYEATRDRVIAEVWEAKCKALAALDPERATVAELNSATTLHLQSLHDTGGATATPDGAVNVPRGEDRMPGILCLSNRGDARGEAKPGGAPTPAGALLSMPGAAFRSLGNAFCTAFDATPETVWINHPYGGGYEVQRWTAELPLLNARAVIARDGLPPLLLTTSAYQTEFLREFLMGEEAAGAMHRPGLSWPTTAETHVDGLVARLRRVYDLLRRAGAGGVPGPF